MNLKYKSATLFFLVGFTFNTYAQNSLLKGKVAIEVADSLSMLGQYKAAGQEIFRLGDWFETRDSFLRAGQTFKIAGDYYTQDETLFNLSHVAYDKAIENFKKGNSPIEETYVFLAKAACFNKNYDYPNALAEYLKAQHQFGVLKHAPGEGETLLNLSLFYRDCKNMPAAFESIEKAIAIHQNLKDSSSLYFDFINIGMYNDESGKYDLALDYYFKAMPLSSESENILFNNISNTYKNQKNYPKSLIYAQNALKSAIAAEEEESLPTIYSTLCELYLLLNQPLKALDYGLKSMSGAKDFNNLEIQSIAHKNLSEIYEKLGKPKEALFYHKGFIALKDRILNDEKDREVTKRSVQFKYELLVQESKSEQAERDTKAKIEIDRQKMVRNALIGGFAFMLLIAGLIFRNYRREKHTKAIIEKEKQKSDDLLLNILPAKAAEELKTKGFSDAQLYENATVLFTDFKDFTLMSEIVSPATLVKMIDFYFSEFDRITTKFNIEKIKTVGDAYVCANGLNQNNTDKPSDVVKAAIEMQKFSSEYRKKCLVNNVPFFECRIGINTGSVVAGVVGIKKFTYDIWGDTVNVAARMEQHGEPGKINVSEATYLLIKEEFQCEYRGKILAKNKGEVSMYFVA
jgi:adenylate cyclase